MFARATRFVALSFYCKQRDHLSWNDPNPDSFKPLYFIFRQTMDAVDYRVAINCKHNINWVRNVSLFYPLIMPGMTPGILNDLGWAEVEINACPIPPTRLEHGNATGVQRCDAFPWERQAPINEIDSS
jgi:hypothetical protein